MLPCKVFQILKAPEKAAAGRGLEAAMYDVFVTPVRQDKDVATCKVVYYKERPKIFPQLCLGKKLIINKALLVPTDVFPKYRHNVSAWKTRVEEFSKPENLREVAKDAIRKTKTEPNEIKQKILAELDTSDIALASVRTKRVHITSKLIKAGRLFVSKTHKIKVDKVSGDTVYFTTDNDLKNPKRSTIIDLVVHLNRNEYGCYPFWVELSKELSRILRPYIGLSAVSWVLDWLMQELGVES